VRLRLPQRPGLPHWPLYLIGAPAAVAIWSGWVGLGGMCGFGPVRILPGIASGLVVNTAITLPVGVEAYGAYALGAWLEPGTPERARRFARWSALGALALGMAGQIIFHILTALHVSHAPGAVVSLVSCMPVVTLGFGVALAHLMRSGHAAEPEPAAALPEPAPAAALPEPEPEPEPEPPSALPELAPEPEPAAALPASKADAVRSALRALGPGTAPAAVVQWLAERGVQTSPQYVRDVRTRDRAPANGSART